MQLNSPTKFVYFETQSQNERYIKGIFNALDIKQNIEKEVAEMEFNIEKLKEYYADLQIKKDEAVAIALANKDQIVAERFEAIKAELAQQVEAEIVANAEAPFKHDIELCEQFIVEESPAVDETVQEAVTIEEAY